VLAAYTNYNLSGEALCLDAGIVNYCSRSQHSSTYSTLFIDQFKGLAFESRISEQKQLLLRIGSTSVR
jgi:hypothetical protein